MLLMRRRPRPVYRHPVNAELYNAPPIGARVADVVTTFLGSWKFIAIQTVIVIIWIVGNVYLIFHFDPYPFILLNLAFSTQAAYAAPLILLAGNRAAKRDRLTLEHAADEDRCRGAPERRAAQGQHRDPRSTSRRSKGGSSTSRSGSWSGWTPAETPSDGAPRWTRRTASPDGTRILVASQPPPRGYR